MGVIWWNWWVWCPGNVELGVIRKVVEMEMEFMESITKGEEVDDEKNWPQDRALGDTSSDKEESWNVKG